MADQSFQRLVDSLSKLSPKVREARIAAIMKGMSQAERDEMFEWALESFPQDQREKVRAEVTLKAALANPVSAVPYRKAKAK